MGTEENPFETSSRYVSEGKLKAAIYVLEQRLRDLPATPFHEVIGYNGFLPLANELGVCLETFVRSFAEPRELQAIYLELGEIEINPYNWFCRSYSCDSFVNPNTQREEAQSETLDLPTVPWPESTPLDAFFDCVQWEGQVQWFCLEAYLPLHRAFRDYETGRLDRERPLTKKAYDLTAVLLIRRFQELVEEVHTRAKGSGQMFGRLPLISAGYGDETFFVSLK